MCNIGGILPIYESNRGYCSRSKNPDSSCNSRSYRNHNTPLFGAYCSANAKECIKRIAQYKALIGAIIFDVTEHEKGMTINIEGEGNTTTHYVTFYCLNGFEYSLMFYRIGYTL